MTRTRLATVTLIIAALATLVGCAATATPGPAPLPAPPAPTVPTVQHFGEPFEPVPGVTVTVTAQAVQVPVGVTGAYADGYTVKITYKNDTDQPLAQVAPVDIRVADQDGHLATLAGWTPDGKAPNQAVGKVFPGHTGTLLTSGTINGWATGQPLVVDVPRPVPVGQTPNPFANTTTVVGTPTP
jgi:hypothetical protein